VIPAFVVGILIGGIVGAAAVAWWHAQTDVSPAPSVGISAISLGNGKGGHFLDAHHARLLRPILKHLGREVM
jgi:hypothetical protein